MVKTRKVKMFKRSMNNAVILTPVNASFAFLLVFVYKMLRLDYSLDNFIQWVHDDTKRLVTNVFAFFLILLFSSFKFELKIYERCKEDFPMLITAFKYIFIFFFLFVSSFIINYYFQYFQELKDPLSTVEWVKQNTKIFFAGVLYLIFLFLLTFSIAGNIYVSSIFTSFILIALGFCDYTKLNLRVEPLYPSDFEQISQLKEVIPMIAGYLSFSNIILVLLLFIFLGIIIRFLPKLKVSLGARCTIFVLAIVMVYSFSFFSKTFMNSFVTKSNVAVIKWNQIENYKGNGFLFGFLSNLETSSIQKPAGYSKQYVLTATKKYAGLSDLTQIQSKQLPNIVYIMSESFWDPTKLNLNFSGDPMSHIRQLMSEQTSGYSLSPTFGGGTANVEFEALTGFTASFLQGGAMPYTDSIDRKSFIPTIVSDLECKGYDTLAIHPFNRVFYKRDTVYKVFGFDQFLDEKTMKNTQRVPGGAISDESLTKEIADNIKSHKKPLFIHAVSIQNHIPYNPAYEENKIKVTGLTSESTAPLEVYTEGIRETDEAVQDLVNRLKRLKEPTIVVFWGDHLPILGANMSVYKEAGYDVKNKLSNERKYSETPLLIYSNYGTKKEELNTVSPFYFAPIVYDLAGLKKPPFYNLLDKLREQIPAIKGKNNIGSDQQYMKRLTKEQHQLLDDYRLLEYDLLAGKQYSLPVLYPGSK